MIQGYCVKCREKRDIQDAKPGFNKKASAVTTGTCGVCGTKMYRIGKTPAHEGLTPPEK